MVNVTISVILPVYNGETYIKEAIDSILNQTFTDWELIVVDDASTDGTSDKILEYTDTRIVYRKNEYNLGNYPARNIGIQLANGRYIAVMDADDIAYPERLHKEYEYLENHPDILAVGSECTINGQRLKRKLPTDYDDIQVTLLSVNCFIHSSLLIRTSILQILGGYNTQFIYAADYDLVCRIALQGKIGNLAEVLMMYRWHEKQISQRYAFQQQGFANKIRCLYQLGFIRKYAVSQKQSVDLYAISDPEMGELISLYLFSAYTKSNIYEKRADKLLDKVMNRMGILDFNNFGDVLSSFYCGILYLLRNNLVEGCENDILEEIDQRLGIYCSTSDFEHLRTQKIDGWIHYLRLRVLCENGNENIRASNVCTLNRLLVSFPPFPSVSP